MADFQGILGQLMGNQQPSNYDPAQYPVNPNDPSGLYLGNLINQNTTGTFQAARNQQGLMGMAAGLLKGGAPQVGVPVTFGSALAEGITGMMAAQNALTPQALQAAQTAHQIADTAITKLQGLGLLNTMDYQRQRLANQSSINNALHPDQGGGEANAANASSLSPLSGVNIAGSSVRSSGATGASSGGVTSLAMLQPPEVQEQVAKNIATTSGLQHWGGVDPNTGKAWNPALRSAFDSAGLPLSGPISEQQWEAAKPLILKLESMGGQNVRNYHFDATHTAGGPFQITNSTWKAFGGPIGQAQAQGPNGNVEFSDLQIGNDMQPGPITSQKGTRGAGEPATGPIPPDRTSGPVTAPSVEGTPEQIQQYNSYNRAHPNAMLSWDHWRQMQGNQGQPQPQPAAPAGPTQSGLMKMANAGSSDTFNLATAGAPPSSMPPPNTLLGAAAAGQPPTTMAQNAQPVGPGASPPPGYAVPPPLTRGNSYPGLPPAVLRQMETDRLLGGFLGDKESPYTPYLNYGPETTKSYEQERQKSLMAPSTAYGKASGEGAGAAPYNMQEQTYTNSQGRVVQTRAPAEIITMGPRYLEAYDAGGWPAVNRLAQQGGGMPATSAPQPAGAPNAAGVPTTPPTGTGAPQAPGGPVGGKPLFTPEMKEGTDASGRKLIVPVNPLSTQPTPLTPTLQEQTAAQRQAYSIAPNPESPGYDKPTPVPVSPDHPWQTTIPAAKTHGTIPLTEAGAHDKTIEEFRADANNVTLSLPQLQQSEAYMLRMGQIFHDLESGKFAQNKAEIYRTLNGLGIPVTGNETAAQVQELMKSNFQNTLATVGQTKGLSRVTEKLVFMSNQNFTNPSLEPTANFNVTAEKLAQVQQLQAAIKDWTIASQGPWQNLDPSRFMAQWYSANPLQTFIDRAKGQLGPFKGMSKSDVVKSLPHFNSTDDAIAHGFQPGMSVVIGGQAGQLQ